MASHVPVTGKPPRPPNSVAGEGGGPQGAGGGGYASRFKRLQRMQQRKSVSSDIHKMIQKSLPKINGGDADRNRAVLQAVQRSNGATLVPLPGVQNPADLRGPEQQHHQLSPRRKSLPMKTFHFRVNSEHKSFVSKSLPSLPSIPGSPSYPEDQVVSPLTERVPGEKDPQTKVPVFPSKHRFERIVVRKHLHEDSSSEPGVKNRRLPQGGKGTDPLKSTTTTTTGDSKPYPPHTTTVPRTGWGHSDDHGHNAGHHAQGGGESTSKPQTSGGGSVRIGYMQAQQTRQGRVVSATQSEPAPEVTSSRKWKEDCECLRCQMLRRQYREGDSGYYRLWGRYPCHHVDPTVKLDD